jgi:acetoin utilization deacetylase AcuC-like enzyme
MREHVLPALETYQPQCLVIAAGFDAAMADPLAHMLLTADGFERISRHLVNAAAELCNGRVLSILEGGYDLDALSEGVARHVQVLLGEG